MKRFLLTLAFFVIPLSAHADEYAIVDSTNTVVDILTWDGTTAYTPPAGTRLIKLGAAGKGWTYEDGTFVEPPLPPPAS